MSCACWFSALLPGFSCFSLSLKVKISFYLENDISKIIKLIARLHLTRDDFKTHQCDIIPSPQHPPQNWRKHSFRKRLGLTILHSVSTLDSAHFAGILKNGDQGCVSRWSALKCLADLTQFISLELESLDRCIFVQQYHEFHVSSSRCLCSRQGDLYLQKECIRIFKAYEFRSHLDFTSPP